MKVKCSLCGGGNDVHPGQEMLFCAFCGSALVIDEDGGPEHLILPHKRSDSHAEAALRAFLLRKGLSRPQKIKSSFSYVPYVMVEDDRGRLFGRPGKGAPPEAGPLPFPPAGEYCFFDEQLADGEDVIPLDEASDDPADGFKILHLPVYKLQYRSSGKKFSALVMGESYYVYADELPDPGVPSIDFRNLLVGFSLFIAYMFAGLLGHNAFSKALVIIAAAIAGWAGLKVRERLVDRSD
jgi:hypothetical protein